MRVRLLLAACLLICATTSVAFAHQTSVKYIEIDRLRTPCGSAARPGEAGTCNRELNITVRCAPGDVTEAIGLPADATPTVEEVLPHKQVATYVQQWFTIEGCTAAAPTLDREDKFVRVRWQVTCPNPSELRFDFTRFFELDRKHEAIVRFRTESTIVRASQPKVVVGKGQSLLAWVQTGMHHIYGGIDHILFVISLLLVVMLYRGTKWELRSFMLTLRSTALVITAFTIAHSITLIAAALGYVSLSSAFVEATIAASITYIAIEDIVKPDVRWRFALTFAFGLIHGLGFAGTLGELLPPRDVVVPLLCFNTGVEIGQLTIVLGVLPIIYFLCRVLGAERYRRYLMPMIAGAIAVAGLMMLIDRV